MSKGPWKKGPRNERASLMLRRLREAAAQEREHSNGLVLDALEKYGALSAEQLVWKTELAKSVVHNAIDRLRREGEIKRLDERRRVGQRGVPAYLYDLGVEDVAVMKREPVTVIVRRHPMDVAFFGEYRRSA